MKKFILLIIVSVFNIVFFGIVATGDVNVGLQVGESGVGIDVQIGGSSSSSNCSYSEGGTLIGNLEKCIGNGLVKDGPSSAIAKWTKNISILLAILAAFGIVYGSFMLTASGGESEKAKKAKNIILWSAAGFILVIIAPLIVDLVYKIMFSIK